MVSMWSSYNLYHKFSFYGNEVLAFGSFFMYLFILKLRERITEEDPWERLTRFVAPVLLFYVMISVLLIHIIYVGRLATGDSANLPQINPLHFVLSNYGFPFAFYFVFLSYLESKDILKSFCIVHKPLVLSAFLVLFTLFIWLYEQWLRLLFQGASFYADLAYFANPIGPFNSWNRVEMLPGLIGSIIAIANMLVLYVQMRKPLPKIGKEEEKMPYAFSLFQFLTKISEVIGGTSITIFRSAIDGYNKRFDKEVQVEDTIKLSNIPEEEWPEFIEFVLGIFYMCIGPITWEEAKQIEGLEEIVRRAKG
jgi:hypothetical protein